MKPKFLRVTTYRLQEDLRRDFAKLIEQCACFECAKWGECVPKNCVPDLYAFLYPRGGFPKISRIAQLRREIKKNWRKPLNKRREVMARGKKAGSAAG
ncbi:MAG: hypothetical protein HWN68_11180 [Desulfobacterales bacterium]|nr:hypothetical protein [Desulfobacterales bacterium]